jgi:hypothetical protein
MLQEELQNALRQIDELKSRNKNLKKRYYWRELGRGIQCLESKRLQSAWQSVTQLCAMLERNMQM